MPSKYGLKSKLELISHIDGVAVSSIIEQYGSPVFIFSENSIRRIYKDAYRAFSSRYPNVQFAWSYKSNYLNAICQVFHQEGAWAEVVSGLKYQKAIANGIPGELIIFNGPDKSLEDLRKAIKNGSLIHIDHFDELYDIIKLSKEMSERPRVAIRVNMDVGIYPKWDRFGFNYENGEVWDALNRIMTSKKLELVGLHTHTSEHTSCRQRPIK
ncbi:MAG: alanine racemase [Thermaurantimonas sp.]|uniref:alanine racemase n=1 Tax=Thermaurantimonas sp. TaxID=2681568 RepID=UPI00391C9521